MNHKFFYLKIAILYCFVLFVFGVTLFPKIITKMQATNLESGRQIKNEVLLYGKPLKIMIPSLDIDLNIIDGTYNKDSKTWTLSPDKAQYAIITPLPNNKSGNTLIYGHNTNQVFYSTEDLKIGDEVFITTDNSLIFVYKYKKSSLIDPTDVSIFGYSGPSQLTLLTCNGFFNTKRKLFYFEFEKVIETN